MLRPAKLQDKLQLFSRLFFAVSGNITRINKNFHEMFALLEKEVYHIFGENCA